MMKLKRCLILIFLMTLMFKLSFSQTLEQRDSTELLPLNSGWRWISFPRMERYAFDDDPYSSVSVLKNVSWYPTDLKLESENGNIFKQYFYPEDEWTGFLDEVYSARGYKLNLDPVDLPAPYITLKGARLYPECPVPLPAPGAEKWIGYFIEGSQYPWNAFPSTIYNGAGGLTRIQAQYWTMDKYMDPVGGWGWIISGKVTPIKYGDMVIIKYDGSQTSFMWNNPDASEDDKVIPKPQAYTWDEKKDYIPFYIETDSTSDIAEIAVIVNGECMGATVRQPSDTLVEVDGYLGELPVGAVIEFETWNGFKSTPVERNGYVVEDPSTQKKEKRNIYVGEKQDFYMVSFKAGEVYELPDDLSNITCMPNPFSNEMTLTMRLNSDQHIVVEVFDIGGTKVKTLLNGNLPEGYYEVKWYGDNEKGNKVSRGIYFYRIMTGNGTGISEKIVLIN